MPGCAAYGGKARKTKNDYKTNLNSMYRYDSRVVITLDAGGTNFVFGAMQANKFIVEPITMPSNAQDLDRCLSTMVEGFRAIIAKLETKPVAISFAFPGPADYRNGVIGGYLPNFPSFRDGVALGPFLEYTFGIPVFINNDGDLFAYGEALGGALPEVNAKLEALGSSKQYRNLIGYTFGTGFGIGIVTEGNRLHAGDNSCVETFCLRHKKMPDIIVEEGVAVRAVKRVYGEASGDVNHNFEPKDICEIADGKRPGDVEAVGVVELIDREQRGGLSVVTSGGGIIFRAKFNPGHIPEPNLFPAFGGANDDLPELLRRGQSPLRLKRITEHLPRVNRRIAERSGRNLHILFTQRGGDLLDGHFQIRHLLRIEPDPHRIFEFAEQLHFAHTGDSREFVLEVD